MASLAPATYLSKTIARVQTRPMTTAGVMLATDAMALVVAGYLGSEVWRHLFNSSAPALYVRFWPAIALFLSVFAFEGLYPGIGIGSVELLRRLVKGTTLIYLMLSAAIFLTKGGDLQSRGGFFTSWILSILLLPLARGLVHHLVASKPWFGVPAVVLGAGRTATMLVERLRMNPELGLKPIACLDDDESKHGDLGGVPVAGSLEMAEQIARATHARYAIVAMPHLTQAETIELMQQCSAVFPHVLLIPNLMGLASLGISPIDMGGVLALELRHNLLFASNRAVKRVLDIAVVILFLPLALALMALAALAILVISPGNPFFLHERIGEKGRAIRILKLRTMHKDADALLREHLASDPEVQREWNRHLKLKHDPRIIPWIGTLLRKSSIDELPQFWNILIGQMSLVGPRPFPRYHTEQFPENFRDLRTKVRPGLTGLWQISARSDGDLETQAMLDTYYIRNWSLWLDAYIISRTAGAVLLSRGAY